MRDFFKRLLWIFQNKADGRPAIIAHMSACMMIPYLSFADITLDGEQYYYYIKKWHGRGYPSYIKLVSMDKYHALSRGVAFGTVPLFLPEFRPDALADRYKDVREKVAPTREFLTQTLLCDILVWPVWCNAKVVRNVEKIKADYGVTRPETRFVGYWMNSAKQIVRGGKVLVSYYKNDNGILAIVGNLNDESQQAELDFSAINKNVREICDMETGHKYKDGRCTINVRARDFVLLYVR